MRIANKQTAKHNATSIHFFSLFIFYFFGHISLILKVNVVAGGAVASATGGITILWAAEKKSLHLPQLSTVGMDYNGVYWGTTFA